MRTVLFLSLILGAILVPSEATAQDFALISMSAARSIQGKANTSAGQATLASANSLLSRSPDAITVLQIAGRLPHDPVYDKSVQAAADLAAMTDLALAYRLTGDRKYLYAATRFIKAWASTYQTALNPIDDQDFYYFFVANDLVNADLPSDVKALTKKFSQQFAQAYLNEIEKAPPPGSPEADPNNPIYKGPNKPDPTRINNFQSHRLKLGVLAAFAAGDNELIKRGRAAYERQMAINIRPDGTVLDFQDRDALHYVVYDLEPLLLVALAAHAHGQDWFSYRSPSGSSLEAALDWLIPYAEGEKNHEEFVHSHVPFDQTRAKAGVKGFSGSWDPKGAVTTYAYASILSPKYRQVLENVEAHTHARPPQFVELVFE
jgi:Alginate lyase